MPNIITTHEITLAEAARAANTLFQAFQNDPLMNHLFVTQENYQKNGLAAMTTWVKYCIRYGKAFRTENFEAVGLRRKPGDLKMSFWRIMCSGMLKTPQLLGKNGMQRLHILDKTFINEKKKNMGNKKFWYCWMLGTLPTLQNRGYGSAIMQRTFDLAKEYELPCYLETATESALQIHINKGFKQLSEFTLPESQLKIYTMIKEN